MDVICEKDLCTGCGACFNKCPQGAISMQENDEGFLYPVINTEKCTNCGLCQKTCPIGNYKNDNDELSDKYLVMASDEIRKTSSSGGAFRVLTNYVLKNNGYVCGAVFNENMEVEHILSNKTEDILRMSDSKYVQSDIKNCYKEIREKLDNDILVLFSGCPCQVAGLKNYLQKNYENLITLDLICHGVPSPLVLKKYFEEEYPNEKVLDIKFRSKKYGYGHGWTTLVTTNKQEYVYDNSSNFFVELFSKDLINRPSCHHCNFAKKQRIGDFTICDAWGYIKKLRDNKGTSIIFLNNDKAKNILKKIKREFKKLKKISKDYTQYNMCSPTAENPSRKDFFENIKSKTLKESFELSKNHKKNIAILNFFWEKSNYGAVLTAFALNRVLNNLGYNAQNINYVSLFPALEALLPTEISKKFESFVDKYIKLTKPILLPEEWNELNNTFDNFIVGSDQVWRYGFIQADIIGRYFLDFANSDKNILSYAASAGTHDLQANLPPEINELYKMYIKNFNSISVREKELADYCINEAGINATVVADPVFLLDKKIWEEIATTQNSSKECHELCIHYFVNELNDKTKNKIEQVKKYFNLKDIYPLMSNNLGIEEWLWQIKNCKFLITESFHASCFAILFNKQFLCIPSNKDIDVSRMKSIFENLGINTNRIVTSDEINMNILNEPIDYDKVNEKTGTYREMSINWLKSALNKDVKNIDEKNNRKKEIFKYTLNHAQKHFLKALKKYIIYRLKYKFAKENKKIYYEIKEKRFTAKYKALKYILKSKNT